MNNRTVLIKGRTCSRAASFGEVLPPVVASSTSIASQNSSPCDGRQLEVSFMQRTVLSGIVSTCTAFQSHRSFLPTVMVPWPLSAPPGRRGEPTPRHL